MSPVYPLHIEYIAWYIIRFEATYYKLATTLILYNIQLAFYKINVVVSVLVPGQCTQTEAYCSCVSTLHATYDKIRTTCTNKTIPKWSLFSQLVK